MTRTQNPARSPKAQSVASAGGGSPWHGGSQRRGRWRRPAVAAAVLGVVLVGATSSFGVADTSLTAAHTAQQGNGEQEFDVTEYDVQIEYAPDSGVLHGVTTVTAEAGGELPRLAFELRGPEVRSVHVDSKSAGFSQAEDGELDIEPARAIPPGTTFQVRVEYEGEPGPGWLPTESGGATAMMGSAGGWIPVQDTKGKADFRLTAAVAKGWEVVSVGEEEPPVPGRSDTTFRWAQRAVDTDRVAIAIDRLTVERDQLPDGTPVVNAYAPGLRDTTEPLADRLPEIIDFLSERFGPYPHTSAGNVFVHVDDDGPGTAPQSRAFYLGAANTDYMTLDMVVHEQAHQWYGNHVSAAGAEDTCLNECFATYATWLWDEEKEGADLDARYREQVLAGADDSGLWGQLYQPGTAPGMAIYRKGPLAMHALRHQIGDAAFDRLIEEWPSENAGAYATWPQFEDFAEQISGQNLSGFFRAWARETGTPDNAYLWPGELRP